MKIPSDLRREKKTKLISLIREMEKAIKVECFRCMNASPRKKIDDCGGLALENGNCPLYDFRPWKRRRKV